MLYSKTIFVNKFFMPEPSIANEASLKKLLSEYRHGFTFTIREVTQPLWTVDDIAASMKALGHSPYVIEITVSPYNRDSRFTLDEVNNIIRRAGFNRGGW